MKMKIGSRVRYQQGGRVRFGRVRAFTHDLPVLARIDWEGEPVEAGIAEWVPYNRLEVARG